MSVDNLFRTIERRTEQDLYRMTFRMTASTQAELMKQIEENRKALRWKRVATEVLWFFASAALGLLLGYILNETLLAAAPGLRQKIAVIVKKDDYVFYLLSLLCFIGVYITRVTIWALKLL